jgi:hypothetical protein
MTFSSIATTDLNLPRCPFSELSKIARVWEYIRMEWSAETTPSKWVNKFLVGQGFPAQDVLLLLFQFLGDPVDHKTMRDITSLMTIRCLDEPY